LNHIVIEANCFFDLDEEETNQIPRCCKYGPGNVSINCLKYDECNHNHCPHLVFGTAKASLVLTDGEGNAINSDSYWGDLKMSEEEWIKEEEIWIQKKNAQIVERDSKESQTELD